MTSQHLPVRGRRSAFTLVELLVVIGIIALLIAILLPSLATARRSAQRTACAAKLQQMMLAATMHKNDHHDYYPLAGIVPAETPEGLDDAYCQKYDYLSLAVTVGNINSGTAYPRKIAPITDALSIYMGFGSQILQKTNANAVSNMYDPANFIRNFLCPSQASNFGEMALVDKPGDSLLLWVTTGLPGGDTGYYSEPQSYVYNEAVLGWYDTYYHCTPRPHVFVSRRPPCSPAMAFTTTPTPTRPIMACTRCTTARPSRR